MRGYGGEKETGTRGWQPRVDGALVPSEPQALRVQRRTPGIQVSRQPGLGRQDSHAGFRPQRKHWAGPLGALAGAEGTGALRAPPPPPPTPLPPVGAPSRALIGAAAAAGRVSAASLRDATPSNCGWDRRYAAASCPGAGPGRPRPRPAPRPARPSASGRAGTLRHAWPVTAGFRLESPLPTSPDLTIRPSGGGGGGHLSPKQLELGLRPPAPSPAFAGPLAGPQTSTPKRSSSALRSKGGRPIEGV